MLCPFGSVVSWLQPNPKSQGMVVIWQPCFQSWVRHKRKTNDHRYHSLVLTELSVVYPITAIMRVSGWLFLCGYGGLLLIHSLSVLVYGNNHAEERKRMPYEVKIQLLYVNKVNTPQDLFFSFFLKSVR